MMSTVRLGTLLFLHTKAFFQHFLPDELIWDSHKNCSFLQVGSNVEFMPFPPKEVEDTLNRLV
ncbi:BnaC06g17950D [Brassica napus]|uniref:BnaC06g17950D protein n=1 Tax=Brassica napus TaxID=3708 RepID=A0A078GKF1_BRANA|nr:BnaC06g17950D [Brassica napus]